MQYQQQQYFKKGEDQDLFDLRNSDQYSSSISSDQLYFKNINQDLSYYQHKDNIEYQMKSNQAQLISQENISSKSSFAYNSFLASSCDREQNQNQLFNLFQYQAIEESTQQQQDPISQNEIDSTQKSPSQLNEPLAIIPRKQHVQYGIIEKPIKKQQKKQKNNQKMICQNEENEEDHENNKQKQGQGISSKYNYIDNRQNIVGALSNSKKKKKFGLINILKNIVIDKSFLLPGQIIINTQFDQGYKNVYMNSDIYQAAKRVEKVIYNKERNTFESHFQTINAGLNNFEFIIKLLESKQDQQIYQQAQVLKQYQQFVASYQTALEQVKQIGIFDQELFQQNTEKYIQKAEEILSKQPKDSIYIYFFNRINYEKGIYEEMRFGFNKGVCAIIGIDEESAIQFSNQMIILCMMTPESQFKYYTDILQAEMQGQTQINLDYQQYTYEGLEIKLSTKQTIHYFPGQLSPKDFSLRILEIEPDIQTLQEIIKQRNQPWKVENEKLLFDKQELNRYQAGLKFLEDFYQSKSKKKNKPIRCDFVVKQALPICNTQNQTGEFYENVRDNNNIKK